MFINGVHAVALYFRADTIAGVIQDAKFKRRDALADLAKAASKK